jgi:hypothetical protein
VEWQSTGLRSLRGGRWPYTIKPYNNVLVEHNRLALIVKKWWYGLREERRKDIERERTNN